MRGLEAARLEYADIKSIWLEQVADPNPTKTKRAGRILGKGGAYVATALLLGGDAGLGAARSTFKGLKHIQLTLRTSSGDLVVIHTSKLGLEALNGQMSPVQAHRGKLARANPRGATDLDLGEPR